MHSVTFLDLHYSQKGKTHECGTLPVTDYFQRELGQDIVFLAWSMPEEHLHGPDEFFRLENFDRGMRVYADLFESLNEQWYS